MVCFTWDAVLDTDPLQCSRATTVLVDIVAGRRLRGRRRWQAVASMQEAYLYTADATGG